MKTTKKIQLVVGIVWLFVALFGPFYVGYEVLPGGWASSASERWWTIPMMLCLCLFGSTIFLAGGAILNAVERKKGIE